MSNKDPIKDNAMPFNNITDDFLIIYCRNLLINNKIEFLNELEKFSIYDKNYEELTSEKYKNINLIEIFDDFIIKDKNDSKVEIEILKRKKLIFQKLWPFFVRNAIKYLRDKDSRDKGLLKFDFGVENLTDYFNEFSDFEEIIYGIDEYYRDHSQHVFKVFFLGEYLIRKFMNGFDKVQILNKPFKEMIIKSSEMEAIWCIIALCHDLGYPLQKLDELNKKLIKILEYFGTSNFNPLRYSLPLEGIILDKFILKIISSRINKEFRIHHQPKFFTKYSNAYEKLKHGMMSCILLMKNLVYFKETDFEVDFKEGFIYDASIPDQKRSYEELQKTEEGNKIIEDARQYIIRREILRSIASHDNEDLYHINMNNFLFLLIMCDELQEWNRPSASKRLLYHMDKENEEIINIIQFNEKEIEIEITLIFDNTELKDYITEKFRRFIRLLRSAVDSDKRKFNFKISLENNLGTKYVFTYKNPAETYKGKTDKTESYPKPTCEGFGPDGKQLEFSLGDITSI